MELIQSITNKIRILPPSVANQIAAGEVIERPASIIKELLENSIDAGSDNIIVTVRQAGNSLIRITDNGCGISKDDLPYAICQHATSKLHTLADLDNIASLGFRGEALASICAVAKCKIISHIRDEEQAWSLEISDNSGHYNIMPAAHPLGTTIEVSDLFYNLPVRKRFLKSDKTEYQQIIDVFQKMALSNFSCAFTLINENKVVYKLLKADTKSARIHRVKKIFGSIFVENAIYFEGEAQGLTLHGWVSGKNTHRSQADQQYFFLNNRIIRDKLILHAVKVAYDNIIPDGRHPCYILYLTIDPSEIDVNVHPTKHEVRFANSRWIHQFIVQQLKKILGEESHNLVEHDLLNQEAALSNSNFENAENSILVQDIKRVKTSFLNFNHNLLQYKEPKEPIANQYEIISSSDNSFNNDYFSNNQASINLLSPIVHDHGEKAAIGDLGIIIAEFSGYLLITKNLNTNQYYIIDLYATYNYLVYEKLEQQWLENAIASTKLTIANQILLDDLFTNISLLNKKLHYLNQFDQTLFIQKIPHVLKAIKFFGFDYSAGYIEFPSDGQNLDNSLNFVDTTGEVINSIIITAVPEVLRYVDSLIVCNVFLLFLFHNDFDDIKEIFIDSSNVDAIIEGIKNKDNSLTKLANLLFLSIESLGRLSENLLLIEQQAILDKLAKIGYNELTFMGHKVVKALSTNDLQKLLL